MEKTPSENLFDTILKQELVYINDLISDRTVENYYLDFKRTEKHDYTGKRKLFPSDKKNYAKAISAFGNSDGGVIIWGIKTGKSDSDYAASKETIKNVSNFLSLLEGFTSILTIPPHPNVYNKIVYENKTNDEGYIITYIPKSNHRPFQVINEGAFQYYLRAGSSSLPASDTFLRSLFGREPQPNALIIWNVKSIKIIKKAIHLEVGMMIHNNGENIAKNINGYLSVGGLGMTIIVNPAYDDFTYNTNAIDGRKVGFTAKPNFILGVEQEILPLTLNIEINKPITEHGIQIIALINADNQQSYRIKKEITKEQLEDIYDKYIEDNSFDIVNAILDTTGTVPIRKTEEKEIKEEESYI